VGLENLIKERQMIRQMREQYQGRDAKPLPPLLFAGIIMEGGIVGYDSNTLTGGSGMRIFGIGAQTQYQSDTVTVSLRTVSVASGEILTSVTITKTVLSYMDKLGVLKFASAGEQAIEAETGASINESINKAVSMSIQAAVVTTIKEGARKGHWGFKEDVKNDEKPITAVVPQPAEIKPAEQPPTENTQSNVPVLKKQTPQGVVTEWSNIRAEKDLSGKKITSVKPGTRVEILNAGGEHYFVRVDGKEGWIAGKYIKVQ
jgi:curli production assembly/transport component CsgG